MNAFLKEFFATTGTPRRAVLLLALAGIVSGAANAALLAIVGETLRHDLAWQPARAAGWFVGAGVLFLVLQRYSLARSARLTEEATARIRLSVIDAAFEASLADSERIDHHRKRLILSRDAAQVASALPNIVALLSSLATVLGALGYLFWLSPVAGAVVCVVIALAVATFQVLLGRTTRRLRAAYAENDRAFGFVDDLLHGHKELKLDAVWAREFVDHDLVPSVERASTLLGDVRSAQQDIGLIGVVAFLVLLGAATFLSPLLGFSTPVMVNALLVLLFIQAHIHGIVLRLPGLVEMRHSASRIRQLVGDLRPRSSVAGVGSTEGPPSVSDTWRQLRLCDIGYSYVGQAATGGFQLRDVDLTIARGQTVFIVGGNGSGKTTLAKILVGLYTPTHGEMHLGDTAITEPNRAQYRQLFNAVFSDVHLFRRRTGGVLTDLGSEVHQALAEMSIRLVVSDDQRLDVKPFSQGQKKRLASALALASDKPLCLFDEWTADQDPEFRAYFHTRYLPALKAAGKTLLVISHDDQYFHHADLIVRMDGGRVASVAPPQPAIAGRTVHSLPVGA